MIEIELIDRVWSEVVIGTAPYVYVSGDVADQLRSGDRVELVEWCTIYSVPARRAVAVVADVVSIDSDLLRKMCGDESAATIRSFHTWASMARMVRFSNVLVGKQDLQ